MTPTPRKRFVRLTPLDDPKAFGPRLRAARVAAEMSLRDLSFPGCSPSYISRLENGSRLPSLQLVNALASRLGVQPEDLLGTTPATRLEERLTDGEVALRLGDVDAARACFEEVSEHGDGDVRALALGGLAQVRDREGETDEAFELFQEARALLGPRFPEHASLVQALGSLLWMRSEYDEAIALFSAGREAAQARGDRATSLRMTLLQANTYIDLGALPESAEQLAAALREADAIGDHDLRARTLWSQSRLHTIEGRHDLAAQLARRALAVLEVSEDELSIARAKQLLAYIELERDDAEAALALLREAVPIVERTGNAQERALVLLEQARVLVRLGELDEARELAIEVAPILTRAARADSGRCFTILGDIWRAVGDPEASLAMYDAAIDALDGHRSPWLATAYKQKASLLEEQGDDAGALALLKRAVDAEARSGQPAV
ncbi:MAG TPA: helix-turn-helix domain-containing protein [Gaiellaceae bacterium]|nr:helix-turn-helix domain-containing protein [Gaiellaceae bacterium]